MVKMQQRIVSEKDVLTLARERCAYTFDSFDHVFVSFSGGKDSTAVLNVALEVAHSNPAYAHHLPLRVVFFDEEAIPQETHDYVERVAARDDVNLEWYCLPVQHRNACSRQHPYWWPWAPEDREKWVRPLPPRAITTLPGFPIEPPTARLSIPAASGLLSPPTRGTVGMMMGIRAQESLVRTRMLQMKRPEQFLIPYTDGTAAGGNVTKSYPIYDWRTEDVWTAPARLGWDYNRAYDRYEMAGVPHAGQRCSPAFGEQPLEGLHQWAECFPEIWARMTDRVPGVGAAVRYARTELYGSHSVPPKPPGLPWPEFIAAYIAKHAEETRHHTADHLRSIIGTHYAKFSHPIFTSAKHPQTGVSWNFLLRVALRGDLKRRMWPSPTSDDLVTQWDKFATQAQAELDRGVTAAELGFPGRLPRSAHALIPKEYRR